MDVRCIDCNLVLILFTDKFLEDLYLAEQRLADIRAGKAQTIPLEELMKDYDLDY
jgi:predicted DNA-binding protein